MYERNRSKAVELLARFWDHAKRCHYLGFRMLTLGWSDGHTFLPVDFSLLSSNKSQINGISEKIDKRTSGYKRRTEALRHAPELIPLMIDRVLAVGMTASYVLMDSWFTYAPLIGAITQRGLDVIGMVKSTNQRYLVNGRKLSLKELYSAATPVQGKTKGILRSIRTHMVPFPNLGMSGRLNRRLLISYFVFLKHYSNHLSFSATSPTGLSCSFALILQDLSARTAITLGNFLQSAIILFAI